MLVPGLTMLMQYSQFALFAAVAFAVSLCLTELHVRNRRSWEAIAIQLQPAMDTESPRKLFRRAAAMMQAADYVDWRTNCADRELLEGIRDDALALRVSSARAILGMQRRSRRG